MLAGSGNSSGDGSEIDDIGEYIQVYYTIKDTGKAEVKEADRIVKSLLVISSMNEIDAKNEAEHNYSGDLEIKFTGGTHLKYKIYDMKYLMDTNSGAWYKLDSGTSELLCIIVNY